MSGEGPARPRRLPVERTLRFLRAVLPPPPVRVLEVGCGDGEVAAGLIDAGYPMVALDVDEGAVAGARARGVEAVRADFLAYQAPPFDAVLFTRSLHHIHPLAEAVAQTRRLLAPGGTVVLEEFAHERVDADTAAWHFDTVAVLTAAGLLPPHPHDDDGGTDPMRRWHARFAQFHGELATAAEMVAAIGTAFTVTRLEERVPYHYRFLAERLPETPAALEVARRALAIERRRMARAAGPWAGLRMVGRAAP